VAEMAVYNPFDFFLEPFAEHFPFAYEATERRELQPFLFVEPLTPRLSRYLDSIDRRRQRTIDLLVGINSQLQHDISYVIRLDPGVQEVERTLELATGSCRDTTWLLVQLLRHLGLAARFVSGYLIQLVPDVKALDGPVGASRDFTDLHAWCEVYLPGAGWIGLDPTSGLLAGEGHIPLACTPEPMSAAPISGGVEPCTVDFLHEMSVQRIAESPRVTKPYSDAQWEMILECGRAVDADLNAGDVRLTMGGEPTFVATTDRDADEWNTAALGENKQRLSGELLNRLRASFAPGGLLHFGQGKWYPGESLPRWSYTCYWRTDGVPLWHDMKLVATPGKDYGHGPGHAQMFAEALAEYERAQQAAGDVPLYGYAVTLARAGQTARARAMVERLLAYGRDHYLNPITLVAVYSALGDRDRAFAWLDRTVADRTGWLWGIATWPEFDALQDDPRLAQLIRRMGLPTEPRKP